jgi:hypothetical protein
VASTSASASVLADVPASWRTVHTISFSTL